MTDDDLLMRRRKADEDVQAYCAGRPTTIGSHADVVRIFRSHIVALRQAGASWEEVGAKLEDWSGRKIAAATVKQYMTDINKGRMTLEPRSTVRPQAETLSAPPAETSKPVQDSRTALGKAEASANDRQSTASGPGLSDGTPIPGGFTPAPVEKWKRQT